MKKAFIVSLVACGMSIMLNAQELSNEVVSSSGNTFEQSSASLEWTLGETVVETYSDATATLTQGFHQPTIEVSTSYENPDIDIKINVYPSPFTDNLTMELDEFKDPIQIVFYDVKGNKILVQSMDSNLSILNLSQFSPGEYFLSVTDKQGKLIKTITVIKK